MNRIILSLLMAVLLGACGAPSVQDLMDDPELLGETTMECGMEKAQGKALSERCRNAQKANERMIRNLMR